MSFIFDFFLAYWTPIVSTISFFVSTYLLIINWLQSRTHISFDEVYLFNILDAESIILITVTNKSNKPIAITNASYGMQRLVRATHRRVLGNNYFAYTSTFPVNIKPNETTEILMELEPDFNKLAVRNNHKLILITSKRKVSKVISKLESKTTPSQLAKLTSKVRKESF